MSFSLSRIFIAPILCMATANIFANPLQVASTLNKGNDVWEFYKAAVANPVQITFLSNDIESMFRDSSTRYQELNNKFAESVNWFKNGTMGADYITLQSEKSPDYEYGYYSITLKKLDFKQCQILANYPPFKGRFEHVEINDAKEGGAAACKSKWFTSDNNSIKFVSY